MSDFMNFVLSYLAEAIVGAVFTVVVGALVLWTASKRHKRKHGSGVPFPWAKAILLLILTAYLAVVLFVTVRRGGYYTGGANVHLFRAWREAWNSFSERQWMNVLLNIAMFMPLGFLLPLIWKKFRKWYLMLPMGCGVSLFIEAAQLLKGSGLFDVDDLFTNTLGTMIGFWMVMAALSLRGKRWAKALCHGLALLAVAGSIGGIFVAYGLQEYGNLSISPAYRVDTKNIQWTIACDLSEETGTVDIYRTEPWTKETCEAFGRKFLENLDVERVDVTIYNDEVYFREYQGSRILEVFYQGGHYRYSDLDTNRNYVEVGEEQLREALLDYGIEIPEAAAFSYEDNTHYFRVSRYVEGSTMIDGAVSVRWEDGCGIQSIDNDLLDVSYYGAEKILSPKAAAQHVMDGYLMNGYWFEHNDPCRMEILSCEFSYQVDTKGFYQPVYQFLLKNSETDSEITEIVPAMK